MIQQLLPCVLYSEVEDKNDNDKISITLTGGTLVKFSPTIYYLNGDTKIIACQSYMKGDGMCRI